MTRHGTAGELVGTLRRIDGRGYKAYRDLRGAWELDGVTLFVDHVQGDPFAAPSKVRVRITMGRAAVPADLRTERVRRIALEDALARRVRDALARGVRGRRGSGKSGAVRIDAGGQEVLERTAVRATPDWIEARLEVGLPAAGRRVLGREAEELLAGEVPAAVAEGLLWERQRADEVRAFVDGVEDQEHVRARLAALGLVAFVADGSILPRASGVSDAPLPADEAVPFRSPASLRVSIDVPHGAPLVGMGLPRGVTLIVGGGYHGKSTLLRALERGVAPHVPGDGREGVVTDPGVVKIRAEDGRRVERVDIRAFIGELPGGRGTAAFSTDDASGSTSQAANIVEALEAGATGLLLDEDTSATNFMVRDARIQALVRAEHEPITPFLERVRELYEQHGVSTVLVMGGCGDYFDVADRVVMMRAYVPEDATERARSIAREMPSRRSVEALADAPPRAPRVPLPVGVDASRGARRVKIDARGVDQLRFGDETIDLRGVEQLLDTSQTRAVGRALHLAARRLVDGRRTLPELLDALERIVDDDGLEALSLHGSADEHPGDLARPRRFEIAAALNRLRTLRVG